MAAITEIEGIGKSYAAKLAAAGVDTVARLLKKGATARGRQSLAEATAISPKLILKWVNRADLFRVQGVAEEYSDLLEAAGVDTVVELARRQARPLHAQLVAVNEAKHLVRHLPGPDRLAEFIEHARTLPRVVTY